MMPNNNFRETIRWGLLAGVILLSISAIGMVEAFNERDIITGVFAMGQLVILSGPLLATYFLTRPKTEDENRNAAQMILRGFVIGVLTAVPVVILILVTLVWTNIRDFLVNVSPALVEILTFGLTPIVGSLVLIGIMAVLGIVGAVIHLIPEKVRKPLTTAIIWTVGIGVLSDILLNILRPWLGRQITAIFFGSKGITVITAVIIFVVALVAKIWWDHQGNEQYRSRREQMTPEQNDLSRKTLIGLGIIVMLILPAILGTYLTEVLDNVGLFILMGLGLNIVVGYAGLLDLGYVAFFAIGAYVMGILTSTGDLGVAGISFWLALPISVAVSVLFGITLGVPVLKMRGDYLAIVTLGFGEIIRVLAQSDLLKEVIGGAQGILQIGKPEVFGMTLLRPQQFYYLILAACLLAIFVSWKMRDARLGRQWMAMREDEDVAEAMGIHLVKTKLLAFGMGAAFSGLAGAIFASRLSSIFPNSFNLLISINVLSLIIVGGIGSLPGVIVGALVLVGLPELLREFAEYRLLLYGVLLIVMMVTRPEGLWPSSVTRRELHHEPEMSPGD
ncbi:MAG: leucine/isoleucine/valine transporter permease subunit [Chloroflexi bacterium]|nr:MAG: leucine/isoleucine/valine transporter permease subunit [Chloroflexota bacterium]